LYASFRVLIKTSSPNHFLQSATNSSWRESPTVCTLAGGVGAARFLQGLAKVVPEEEITTIVNTGDDLELHGLYISPDLDIVMYTLAGLVDEEKGWGIQGDTFNCLEILGKYGHETWFRLGDKDLATHIRRTSLMGEGLTLSEITARLCRSLGVKIKLLPMTDDKFRTMIRTHVGLMGFQEYLVKRMAQDEVLEIIFEGVELAKPAKGVVEAILDQEGIIVCPSNPLVSIGTILSLKEIREALRETDSTVVAISPIVGGKPIKGPADKLMRGVGLKVSAAQVAELYKDFLDVFIMDSADWELRSEIERLGIRVVCTNTIMRTEDDKVSLAKVAIGALEKASR